MTYTAETDWMEAERERYEDSIPVNVHAEAHAEAMALGLPCPFDCWACEVRAMRHEHTCTTCGTVDTCHDETCLYEGVTPGPCADCNRTAHVGRLTFPATKVLVIDWTGEVVPNAVAAARDAEVPF